jgi:phosphoserine phosphatase RsbU/P
MASPLRLEQVGGPELANTSTHLADKVLLGRGTDCQVILPDAAISRRHAMIEKRGEQYWLSDLESRAGTFVNDVRVERALALHEHDRLRIGAWRFRVRSGLSAGKTMPSASGAQTSFSGLTQVGAPILAAQARLELLVEFVAACANGNDLAELAHTLMDFSLRVAQAARVSVWLAPEQSLLSARPDNFRPIAFTEAIAACARGGVVVMDLPNQESAAVLAVRIDGEAMAYLQVEFKLRKPDEESLESLHALVRLAGFSAGNVERRSAENRIARLSADLEQARRVQQAILPPAVGQLGAMRYALHVHPGRVVAGDMVDVFALDTDHTAIVLGDVSGAGFGAAVQMAAAQAYLHAQLLETRDPGLAATRCNAFLARIGGGQFVTAWIGVLNSRTGVIQVVDAGHGHTRVAGPQRVFAPVLTGAIPLGIDSLVCYQAETLTLQAGTRLVLFSDGIAEHQSPDGIPFDTRLDAILRRSASATADVEAIVSALRMHAGRLPDDDATVLSIELICLPWQTNQQETCPDVKSPAGL